MKKKILSILVSMAMIVMTLPVANVAFANHGTPLEHNGDVNADGLVNILDIIILVQHINGGGIQLTGANLISGDLNADGSHNILDVVATVNLILNYN